MFSPVPAEEGTGHAPGAAERGVIDALRTKADDPSSHSAGR